MSFNVSLIMFTAPRARVSLQTQNHRFLSHRIKKIDNDKTHCQEKSRQYFRILLITLCMPLITLAVPLHPGQPAIQTIGNPNHIIHRLKHKGGGSGSARRPNKIENPTHGLNQLGSEDGTSNRQQTSETKITRAMYICWHYA